MKLKLYTYWRSSAAYRVRIALNLKGLPHELTPVHLLREGGEHLTEDFARLNPQRLVPVLIDGERVLRQSMAIIEYLDEAYPDIPLMPSELRSRHRVRALAQLVACDIHPVANLRVMKYLEGEYGLGAEQKAAWQRRWIQEGFDALEQLLADCPTTGEFCEGDDPTLADACLAPQVYNAIRFECPLRPYPTIRRIYANCMAVEAFHDASPDRQPDAKS
ncbi:MAG: maleylacetoacetate isomerase [Pseudomonadota bacterium]